MSASANPYAEFGGDFNAPPPSVPQPAAQGGDPYAEFGGNTGIAASPQPQQQAPQATISAAPKTSIGDVLHNVVQIPVDPLGEAGKAWNSIRQSLDSESVDHPALSAIGNKMDALQELLFGGQSVGKPMGTSGGVADEATVLAGAPGLAEVAPAAAEATAGAAKSAVSGASKLIPSAERAGKMFSTVREMTGELPVNSNEAGKAASQMYDMSKRGGSLPKVARDFLNRVTDPQKPPLTYNEARDFYSNASRLSAAESSRLTPVMQRQMALFTKSLGESIKETADQAGQLENLENATKEYRRAKHLEDAADFVKKAVVKGIPYTTAYLVARKLGLLGGE